MKFVYMVQHKRKVEEDATCSKLIGFYSSQEKADEVIKRYKSITGFKDYPYDFLVEKIEINFDDFDFE